MTIAAEFDGLMRSLGGRAMIVTVRHGDTTAGCVMGFGTQVSIDPPRFLACLSDKNRTYRIAARGADLLTVHLVPPARHDLAELFGGETGDDLDKFARVPWHEGPHGAIVLDDCADWFAGRVLERRRTGDHFGFLLEPLATTFTGGGAMPMREVMDIDPGHEA